MSDSTPPVVLIDGSGWIFRAYFALPPFTAPDGTPTGAVYGMNNMLKKLLKDYAPERIAVVFDPSGPTFRDAIYADYKKNRDETPPDLLRQWPLVIELCETMGLKTFSVPGVEADDVIGTLATEAAAKDCEVLIVTSDKDMAQLVTDKVKLLDTMKSRTLDPAGVKEKFGVPPSCIVDYLALMGDTSDNIPGIPGVGEKTAAKLINEHGSLDGVIAAAPAIKGKLGENVRAHLAQLPVAKDLATIRTALELPLGLDDIALQPADEGVLAAFYARLGIRSRGDAPAATAAAAPVAAPPAADAAPLPPERKTQAELVVDEDALARMLEKLRAADLVCFDTETDQLDSNAGRLVGLAFAVEEGRGWYVPVEHEFLGVEKQLSRDLVLERVKPILEDPAKKKVAQHAKYDMNVLAQYGVMVQGVAYDTMLESYVLDAASNNHNMDALAKKYLGHTTITFEDVAGKGKGQLSFAQVPLERAAEYSAEDADITLRLHHALFPRLQAEAPLLRVYETIEMPLLPVLCRMEQAGVRVDVALLRKISGELGVRMEELQAQAYAAAGGEFNIGSPKQLQEILFNKLSLPVVSKTPKGDPSTAEDVLEELAAQHELPRLILDWRAVQKLRSTYAEQLPLSVNPRTGRIHTSYRQAVAATGRLSSQDPNLQNIPVRNAEGRRIRQAFVPADGCTMLSIDYSQIELRLMAHYSGDARLHEAFRSGKDIHQATAAEVFGLRLEEVKSEQRRAAKAINFGLIYGMSSFGLARNLGIGRGEAQDYINRFFGRYPGVRTFMEGTKAKAHETGYVETLFGRRLHLRSINSRNQAERAGAERVAINAPLQGSAADLIKLAMIEVQRWLDAHAPSVRMLMQVHDELVFEGPADVLPQLAPDIAGLMCRVRPLDVPLVADYGIGGNWDASKETSGHVSS